MVESIVGSCLTKIIVSTALGFITGYLVKRGTLENKLFSTSSKTDKLVENMLIEFKKQSNERGIVNSNLEDIDGKLGDISGFMKNYEKKMKQLKDKEKELEEKQSNEDGLGQVPGMN